MKKWNYMYTYTVIYMYLLKPVSPSSESLFMQVYKSSYYWYMIILDSDGFSKEYSHFKKKLDRSLWIQTVSMNRLSIRSLGFASLTLITKRSTPTNCAAAVTTSVCMIARVVVYTISTARKFTTSSKKSRCASYM